MADVLVYAKGMMNTKALRGIALMLLGVSGYLLFRYGELAIGMRNKFWPFFLISVLVNIIFHQATKNQDGLIAKALKFLASCLVAIAMLIGYRLVFEPVYFSSVAATIQLKSDKEMQLLTNSIMDKSWQELSKKEKLDLLQQIVNHEAAELKLKNGIPVEATELPSLYESHITLAGYTPFFKKIIINSDVLDKPGETVLKIILHEARHAQQDYLATAYNNGDTSWMSEGTLNLAEQYSKDFKHKQKAMGSYQNYYEQTIEKDARKYSAQRYKYYGELALYWEELPELPKSE